MKDNFLSLSLSRLFQVIFGAQIPITKITINFILFCFSPDVLEMLSYFQGTKYFTSNQYNFNVFLQLYFVIIYIIGTLRNFTGLKKGEKSIS